MRPEKLHTMCPPPSDKSLFDNIRRSLQISAASVRWYKYVFAAVLYNAVIALWRLHILHIYT